MDKKDTMEAFLGQGDLLVGLQKLLKLLTSEDVSKKHIFVNLSTKSSKTIEDPPRNFNYDQKEDRSSRESLEILKSDEEILRNEEIAAYTGFFILSVGTTIGGAHVGAAAANRNWDSRDWNYSSALTWSNILYGAVGGAAFPFAYFYSLDIAGVPVTGLMTYLGAYLGAAQASGTWDVTSWNVSDPYLYNGIFEGVQFSVWLVDRIYIIYQFADRFNISGVQRIVYLIVAYGSGAATGYHYIAQFHGGNYNFLEWNRTTEPGVPYGILMGMEAGTRLPTGFAEVILEIQKSLMSADNALMLEQPLIETIRNIFNRTFGQILGGVIYAYAFAADINESLDVRQWNYAGLPTHLEILNGIYFGKDFPQMIDDVAAGIRRVVRVVRTKSNGNLTLNILQNKEHYLTSLSHESSQHHNSCSSITDRCSQLEKPVRRTHRSIGRYAPPPVSSGGSSTRALLITPLKVHQIVMKVGKSIQNLFSLPWKNSHKLTRGNSDCANFEIFKGCKNSASELWSNAINSSSRYDMRESFEKPTTINLPFFEHSANKWFHVGSECEIIATPQKNHRQAEWNCQILDNLDGQIVLARVIIHFVSRLRHLMKSLRKSKTNK